MAAAVSLFPASVYDGSSPTRGAEGLELNRRPDEADFAQLREEIQAIQTFLRSPTILVGDGVNSSGGNVEATFTGAVIGQRVIAVIGQTKAADGNAQAAMNSFFKLRPGTDVEQVVSATNKIVFLSGLADKSGVTFFAILI